MLLEDRIASAGVAIGLGATIAAMALPLAYPNAPITTWRLLFWGGLLIALFSLSSLGMDVFWHRRTSKTHTEGSGNELIVSEAEQARFKATVRRLAPELREFMSGRWAVRPSLSNFDFDDEKARITHSLRASQWQRETLKLYFRRFGKEMAFVRNVADRLKLAANQPDDVFSEPTSPGDIDALRTRLFGLLTYLADSDDRRKPGSISPRGG